MPLYGRIAYMRVTMEDIARMAGVSKATVSRVVNGIEQGVGPETRRRVLQIVKETNYRSYSLPSQNQSKTLGQIGRASCRERVYVLV